MLLFLTFFKCNCVKKKHNPLEHQWSCSTECSAPMVVYHCCRHRYQLVTPPQQTFLRLCGETSFTASTPQ